MIKVKTLQAVAISLALIAVADAHARGVTIVKSVDTTVEQSSITSDAIDAVYTTEMPETLKPGAHGYHVLPTDDPNIVIIYRDGPAPQPSAKYAVIRNQKGEIKEYRKI